MQTKYLIVIEKTPNNLSAYSPDLPGCEATGDTHAEVEERMRDAIRMHIQGMRDDGLAVPEPSSSLNCLKEQETTERTEVFPLSALLLNGAIHASAFSQTAGILADANQE